MHLNVVKDVIDEVIRIALKERKEYNKKHPYGMDVCEDIDSILKELSEKTDLQLYLESLNNKQLKVLITIMYLGRDYVKSEGTVSEYFDCIYTEIEKNKDEKSILVSTILSKLPAGEYLQRGKNLLLGLDV